MGYELEVEMIREAAALRAADRAVRVRRRRRAEAMTARGRRRARAAHGADDEGHDRRADRARRSTSAWSEIQAMRDAAVAREPAT